MRMVYGSPPMPNRGRDEWSKKQLEELAKAMKEAQAKLKPGKDSTFQWLGIKFIWEGGSWPAFKGNGGALGWTASVAPEGLAWKATIRLQNGTADGLGPTPQAALDAARDSWWTAVSTLGLSDAEQKANPTPTRPRRAKR